MRASISRASVALAFAAAAAGCHGEARDAPAPAAPPASSGLVPWSRSSAAPRQGGADGGAAPMTSSDPAALDEIVKAAPRDAPPTTGDGGTLIGTDTGAPASSASDPPRVDDAPTARPSVAVGKPVVQPVMSNPAIEKAARAQLYFQLVTRCRDAEGKVLPPDAIRIKFGLDADGLIVPSSILVTSVDPRFRDAATCMRRELSTSAFRGPSGARGQATTIDATVPSVD